MASAVLLMSLLVWEVVRAQQVKDVFGIDPLPVRGFGGAESIVLLSVLLYQLMVCYNRLTRRPSRFLKHMLGS